MRNSKLVSLVACALMASTSLVQAADLLPIPNDDLPPEIVPHGTSGWYIRGDIGYASLKTEQVTYYQGAAQSGVFEQHEIDSTWMLQGGIGYQVTDYLRADVTLGYYGSAGFDGSSAPAGSTCNGPYPGNTCSYNDDAELESLTLLMANAYWDLGTYGHFTPYVGAGIGGAHVSWGNLLNDQTCTPADPACDGTDFVHPGIAEWRFAWALHAGASYDINCDLKLDAGYTYTRIQQGRMFGEAFGVGGGAGFDGDMHIHSARAGLRYQLGGGDCYEPEPIPPVVYK